MMKIDPNPAKKLIPLTIGDPTLHGNYLAPDHILERVSNAVQSHKHNGYPHACGIKEARESVARTHSVPGYAISYEDVILTCGCSQAIEMCISVLANPGDHNILLPRPGFSLYQTLCNSKGIQTRFYSLDPHRQWECNLDEMESLIDDKTAGILVNNPSNPCGSNFSADHIRDIISIAEKKGIPIIADEIYENMVFNGSKYTPFAAVSENVPILHVGGLAKQFMIPGWRLGWIVLHDRHGQLGEIKKGLMDLSTLTLGPTSIVQSVVEDFLEKTDPKYYSDITKQLEESVTVISERLSGTKGLHVVKPEGAMYVMVGIDPNVLDIKDDVEFSQRLLREESVFVLPGQVFQMPNYFRVVITSPKDIMSEACGRIKSFCERIVR